MLKSEIRNPKSKILKDKLSKLQNILSDMKSVVVAYSGGVDSTFLLKVAHDVLKDKVLGVVARSNTYQKKEYADALKLAKQIRAKIEIINTDELENPLFTNNPPERCYYCKKELFSRLKNIANKRGYSYVVYGATTSDIGDFRPGSNAAKELEIRAPLFEAGLGKEDIRVLSKKLGLPTWNKPAMACLASRFPYGGKITKDALNNVEQAEDYLISLGFGNVRVRIYDRIARIEIDKNQINKMLKPLIRGKIVKKFKNLGFLYVVLDLEGYRTGSMNEALKKVISSK